MSGNEIRVKVDENNLKIRKLMDKFDFTLNSKLEELLEENEKLRSQCDHIFQNGNCIWCDEFEEVNEE